MAAVALRSAAASVKMRLLLGFVLVLFSLYTGWVAWEFGYTSVFEVCFREHPSTQAVFDLWIACGLLFVVMLRDNQKSGRPWQKAAPFAVLTLLLGAIGPLLYFFVYTDLLQAKTQPR